MLVDVFPCVGFLLREQASINAKLADVSLLLSPDRKGVLGEWLRTAPSTEAAGSLVAQWGAAAGSSCATVRVMVGGQTQVDGTLAPGPAIPATPGARSVRLSYTVDGANRSQTIVAAGVTDVLMILVFDGLPDDLVVDVTPQPFEFVVVPLTPAIQCAPPSVVRSRTPPSPTAQPCDSSVNETPRSVIVVPVVC